MKSKSELNTNKPEEELFILRPGDDNANTVFANLIGFLEAWRHRCALEIIIRPFKRKRTDLQNRYLHGWIFRKQLMKKLNEAGIPIAIVDGEFVTWDVECLKVYCKRDDIVSEVHERQWFIVDGVEFAEEIHPSQWDSEKFAKYCEVISIHFSMKYNIYIEPPRSGHWLTVYKELINR